MKIIFLRFIHIFHDFFTQAKTIFCVSPKWFIFFDLTKKEREVKIIWVYSIYLYLYCFNLYGWILWIDVDVELWMFWLIVITLTCVNTWHIVITVINFIFNMCMIIVLFLHIITLIDIFFQDCFVSIKKGEIIDAFGHVFDITFHGKIYYLYLISSMSLL